MLALLHLLTAIAVLAVAVGGLAWAIGNTTAGKRAVAFGVVLIIVRNALVYQGGVLVAAVRPHMGTALAVLTGVVLVIALGRIAATRRAKTEPKLAGKRRVARGP